MITDKLVNMGNYRQLDAVKAFLDGHPTPLENGRYVLNDDCFLNVMEYETREDTGIFEGHRKYIDLQMLICGSELVRVQNIADCALSVEHDDEKDAAFYTAKGAMNYYLDDSNFILLEPEDLHDPCITVGSSPVHVKKYVFKISVK